MTITAILDAHQDAATLSQITWCVDSLSFDVTRLDGWARKAPGLAKAKLGQLEDTIERLVMIYNTLNEEEKAS